MTFPRFDHAADEPGQTRPRPTERGFALLIVLWSLVLIALLGSTITATGRSEARIAANLLARARVEAAADGAVELGAYHLLDSSEHGWRPDGGRHTVRIGATDVSVTLQDERGKIDPNETPPGLIGAMLRQLGLPRASADTLALAIVDWRSPADTGFAAHYSSGGYSYGPPHENFQSVDEMGLVAGMNPSLLARLRAHLDVYLDQPPDPASADALVTAALKQTTGAVTAGADDPPGPAVVLITARARDGTAEFTRTAVVRVNTDQSPLLQILDWHGG